MTSTIKSSTIPNFFFNYDIIIWLSNHQLSNLSKNFPIQTFGKTHNSIEARIATAALWRGRNLAWDDIHEIVFLRPWKVFVDDWSGSWTKCTQRVGSIVFHVFLVFPTCHGLVPNQRSILFRHWRSAGSRRNLKMDTNLYVKNAPITEMTFFSINLSSIFDPD